MDSYEHNRRVDLWAVWYAADGRWVLDGVYDDEDLRDRRVARCQSQGRITEYRRIITCTPEQPVSYRAHRMNSERRMPAGGVHFADTQSLRSSGPHHP